MSKWEWQYGLGTLKHWMQSDLHAFASISRKRLGWISPQKSYSMIVLCTFPFKMQCFMSSKFLRWWWGEEHVHFSSRKWPQFMKCNKKWLVVLFSLSPSQTTQEDYFTRFNTHYFSAFLKPPTHEIFLVWAVPSWSVSVSNFHTLSVLFCFFCWSCGNHPGI